MTMPAGNSEPPRAERRGWLEKLVFRPVPLWLLLLSLLLGAVVLIGFGALVRSGLDGGRRFGVLSDAAVAIASIPATLKEALSAPNAMLSPEAREALPDGWARGAGSEYRDDGFALISRYAPERRRSIVQLVRVRDGQVLREYAPDIADINRRSSLETSQFDLTRDRAPDRYRMIHPELMPDGGLIFQGTSPLVRIDACGRVMWTLDGIFHHSIERDAEGNIWVATTSPRPTRPRVSERFQEDGIALVSPQGRVLRGESLLAIFARNGMAWLYEGRPYNDDPFHVNDVQPVFESGPYWRRGDLFLSLRNMSLVMLYRPSTGRVLWWRQGPWHGQHDVNILDDHRISIFDNNIAAGRPGDYLRGPNQILVYDFTSGRVSAPLAAALSRHSIGTITEGRATPLPNGDFLVEESNYGRLLRMTPAGGLRWQYISADADRRRYLLNWSRYLDPQSYAASIQAAVSAPCG